MYERQKAKLKELFHADADFGKGEILQDLKKYKCWIAGGAILSIFTGEEVNDVDVFFRSKEDVFNVINSRSGNWYFTKWSATTSDIIRKPIQLVYKNTFSSVEEIFKTFDFSVCCAAYDCETEEFVFGDTFFEDVMSRTIHFNHHTDGAIMTLPRIAKYQERGYSFPKPELMKVGLTLANYNLQSWDDVSNVLSGTYGSSFSNLADNMKEKGVDFSFDEAINVISKCEEDNIDDEDNRCYISAFGCADTIRKYLGLPIKYFVHNNVPYDTNFCKLTSVPEGSTCVELESLVKLPLTLYKSIERNGRSTYDSNFVYKQGEYAVANDNLKDRVKIAHGAGLYFRRYVNEVTESNRALVIAKVFNYDDIMIETLGEKQSYVVCKRAFIERITTDNDEIMFLKQNERKKNKDTFSF